jgi:hypothetical protein
VSGRGCCGGNRAGGQEKQELRGTGTIEVSGGEGRCDTMDASCQRFTTSAPKRDGILDKNNSSLFQWYFTGILCNKGLLMVFYGNRVLSML